MKNLIAFFAFCILNYAAIADTWTVDDDGKADFDNIRSAVAAASDGDEIIVFPGTYTGIGGNAAVVDMMGREVWLHSSDGQESTFIDGEGSYSGIYCYGGEGGETFKTIIEGFTIKNCSGTDGGGMYLVNNAYPTITNCTFQNNTANYGGGMYNNESNPTIKNCIFKDNTASLAGGGMYNYQSSPTVTNCTFESNNAHHPTYGGGGMFNDQSSPVLENCTFNENEAIERDGGGMFNLSSSSPTLTNCTFTNNSAFGAGGGMFNSGSSPTLAGCSFTGNSGQENGGGMTNHNGSDPTLVNCIFDSNYASSRTNADYGGGGMFNNLSSPILQNCTFIGNVAEYDGGGLFNWADSNPALTNCIFIGNIANDDGGGMYNYDSSPTLSNCSFRANEATGTTTGNGFGGGMLNDPNSYPTITSCTFTLNSAQIIGGGMYNNNSSNPTLTDTIVCGNTPDQIDGGYTDGGNWVDDDCPTDDSDGDGTSDVMDNCYLYNPDQADCNGNGIGDACEIADQTSSDCDQNGVPDECQPDCDGDGHIDPCDIANHGETDWNNNGVPDNCEPDCNGNSIPDDWDIFITDSQDCNDNNIPDECDIADGLEVDCNENGVPDFCDIADATEYDCDENGVLDLCELGELIEIKLVPEDGDEDDYFAFSVSISGDVALIGAPRDDVDGTEYVGSAYVYRFDGSQWNFEQKLISSDAGDSGDRFGTSVCVDGDWAIVGAPDLHDAELGGFIGGAYVYRFNGTAWNEDVRLTASVGGNSDTDDVDYFGHSVSLSGNVAIVGSHGDDGGGFNIGSAYIYRFDGTDWIPETKLVASDPSTYDEFGNSVCISGNTVLVGAPSNPIVSGVGAAYIYRFYNGKWIEEQILIPSNGAENDYFGRGVSISGDIAIVGADGDNEKASDAGAAYIYRFDGSEWIEEDKLLAEDGAENDQFGKGVCISGYTAIVGAHGNDDDGSASGSAYVFSLEGNQWTQRVKLTASDPSEGAVFGYSVSIDGDFMMIGAYGDDDNGQDSGSAYIYGDLTDCNSNGIQDDCDIVYGESTDVNNNGIPDDCELDCNGNAIPDYWDIKISNSEDCNGNVVPDECDITDGTSYDCNANGIPDECETDCNENGVYDECDITYGTSYDCNANSIPDECDITNGTSYDCNDNGVPDECDIQVGTSSDVNENQIPDECECLGDLDSDGLVDISDILRLIDYWGSQGPIGDINEDGVVGAADLLLILWYWGPCE